MLKAMIDIKSSVQLSDADMDNIQETVSALEPEKLAVEALCQRDTNLVSADAVIKFALILSCSYHAWETTVWAGKNTGSILSRIKEHRTDFAGSLIYLNNPKATSTDDTFNIPKAATICKIIQQLLLRLDHCPSASGVEGNGTRKTNENDYEAQAGKSQCDSPPPATELSLKEQMEQAMKASFYGRRM